MKYIHFLLKVLQLYCCNTPPPPISHRRIVRYIAEQQHCKIYKVSDKTWSCCATDCIKHERIDYLQLSQLLNNCLLFFFLLTSHLRLSHSLSVRVMMATNTPVVKYGAKHSKSNVVQCWPVYPVSAMLVAVFCSSSACLSLCPQEKVFKHSGDELIWFRVGRGLLTICLTFPFITQTFCMGGGERGRHFISETNDH